MSIFYFFSNLDENILELSYNFHTYVNKIRYKMFVFENEVHMHSIYCSFIRRYTKEFRYMSEKIVCDFQAYINMLQYF